MRRGKLRTGLLFHQDYARTHEVEVAKVVVQDVVFELFEHSAFSAELAPSDFYHFFWFKLGQEI